MPTYYVSTTGNDSNLGTSQSTPWRSLNQSVNRLSPGDTLLILAGVYYERVVVNVGGTASSPITIKAFGNGESIVDGSQLVVPGWSGLFDIFKSYVIVDGLTIRNSPVRNPHTHVRGVRLYTGGGRIHGVTLRNLKIYNIPDVGILAASADECIIENCIIRDVAIEFSPQHRPGQSDWGGGIAIQNGSANCIVRNCIVHDVWGEPIIVDKGGNGILFEENVIYATFSAFYVHRSQNCVLRRNFIYGITMSDGTLVRGIAVGNEQATSSHGYGNANNTLIENNIVVGCSIGINGDTFTDAQPFSGLTIRHNTLVNNSRGIVIGQPSNVHSGTVENNIVYGSTVQIEAGNGLIYQNNAWQSAPGGIYSSVGDVIGDPRLVNPNAVYGPGTADPSNYRLRAGSPCINVAKPSSVTVDFFGGNRG